MICQSCGKHQATTHVKTVINGTVTERNLCAECAQKEGIGTWNPFQGFSGFENPFFSLSNLFGSFLGSSLPETVTRCPVCGSSFHDISESGKVGCSECYDVFYEQLLPSIQRLHGSPSHTGKNPTSQAMQVMPNAELTISEQKGPSQEEQQIAQYEKEMQQAIAKQYFEQAAVLRDRIRELKQKGEK